MTAIENDYSKASLEVTINGVISTVPVNADGSVSVVVPAGQSALTVQVQSVSDKVYEGPENFTLSGVATATDTNGAIYTTASATGTGIIVDDGSGPKIPKEPGTPDNT